jgi:hypothetical protein
MKRLQAQITTRLVAAMLVTVAVIGVSAFAVRAPAQNQSYVVPSLKSIQTDQATLFYADQRVNRCMFVERVGTSEDMAETENLKLIAAAF